MKTFKFKVTFSKKFEIQARTRAEAIALMKLKCRDHDVYRHWYERDGHMGIDCSAWRYDMQDYLKKIDLIPKR